MFGSVHPRACGEQAAVPASPPAGSVHPRACGEQRSAGTGSICVIGSSPRLRGTAMGTAGPCDDRRFIPAPAGNRAGGSGGASGTSVHPRACGEQLLDLMIESVKTGSSPRLRGTVERARRDILDERFIPAPAGNSREPRSDPPGTSVHPRACGEQGTPPEDEGWSVGSSPRLRGTELDDPAPAVPDRFIPAPAGNRPVRDARRSRRTVHPRACGEQISSQRKCPQLVGSSPRLRGTVFVVLMGLIIGRFIPAPAGNSRSIAPAPAAIAVHPRACGEQT